MNLVKREVSIAWKGGNGAVSAESLSKGSRLKSDSDNDPAALIATAHASSFSSALSKEVGAKAFAAGESVITALVTMEHQPLGWTVTDVHLNVLAMLPKVTQGEFIDATVRAKARCMVSRLLNAKISMNAKLENERAVATKFSTPLEER